MKQFTCGILLGMFALTGAATGADETAVELVQRLPRDANAIVVVKVQEILRTDRATRENLTEQQSERYLNGQSAVPPWVNVLVMGALVRPAVPEADWSATLVTVPDGTKLETLAGSSTAEVEYLESTRALHTSRDALFLDLKPGLLGVMSPAYRQDAGRWCRQMSAGREPEISPFLLAAAQRTEHILLAMDLHNLPDPQSVRRRLSADDSLESSVTTRVRLATKLLGIKGVVMAITIGDQIDAEVNFSFSDEVGESGTAFQHVFLSVLGDLGAHIDEFEEAAVSTQGKTLTLKMNLAEESLRRIMSMVIPPNPTHEVVAETPQPDATVVTPPKTKPKVDRYVTPRESSQRYLLAVNEMIDDLKVALTHGKTYARTATWHENFARKINNLSTVGVDQELVAYGSSVAESMRGLAASLRGQGVRVAANQGALTYSYTTNPGIWSSNAFGVFGPVAPSVTITDSNLSDVRQRQAEAVAAGGDERITIWKQIDDQRASIESQMRERYGDSFGRK